MIKHLKRISLSKAYIVLVDSRVAELDFLCGREKGEDEIGRALLSGHQSQAIKH